MSTGAPSPAQDVTQEVAALRDEVERLQRELETQRETFHRELMRKAYRIAELELRIDEIVERRMKGYEASLSWRITKPLRIAKRIVRRP